MRADGADVWAAALAAHAVCFCAFLAGCHFAADQTPVRRLTYIAAAGRAEVRRRGLNQRKAGLSSLR